MKNKELLEKVVKHIEENYDVEGCMPTEWAVVEMASRYVGRDITPNTPWRIVHKGLLMVARRYNLKV